MVSDKVQFDFGGDEECYKSCFARSMAVNSQHKLSKMVDKVQKEDIENFNRVGSLDMKTSRAEPRLKKETMGQPEEIRRFLLNHSTNGRRGSLCSSRILELPVENFVYQSQIDTLQWQLKETEASREMYRAVMKQVVTFLEKAHRSLELLGSRLNPNETLVSRTRSEHHMSMDDTNSSPTATLLPDASADYSSFRDFTWRRPKKPVALPDEVPPEKLSQEAYRLLRTAQSLLNTREPDLAQMTKEFEDSKFLEQLAKEFPQPKEPPSQRTSSFSLSSKFVKPEKEPKISTAFNRKLSLQLIPSDLRRNSLTRDSGKLTRSSDTSSILSNECCDDFGGDRLLNIHKCGKTKCESEKSASPPVSTISSAEDESGFSSMNSFQEVGVPLVNSTFADDFQQKNGPYSSDHDRQSLIEQYSDTKINTTIDEIKLWQRSEPSTAHRRWNSTPVDNLSDKQSLKVLWV